MNTPQFDLGAMLSAPQTAIQQIPCKQLHPYHNHKFELYSGERLEDMIASIKENGVLSPIIVQPIEGGYEILIGHNRWNASKLAGLPTVPAIVKTGLSEEEAEMYVIESNVMQRGFENLRISEQAAAVALRHSEMFSQGKRNDILRELAVLENPSAEPDTATLNPVGSKSTDLPVSTFPVSICVYPDKSVFFGTNVRMVESYLRISLYFYHIVYRFLRNFRIRSGIVLPATAFLVHCIIRHSTLPLFSAPSFWLLPSRSLEIISAEAILDLKSR